MKSNDSVISISMEEEITLFQQMPPNDVEIEQQERGRSLETSMKEEMLNVLPFDSEKCSIYRVPRQQLNMNSRAYTPQVISIGPFHHGQEHLKVMERHKLLALKIYLRRIHISVEAAIATARNWETKARGFYAEPINMNQDEFVKMMLVDGCFLLEFMLLVYNGYSTVHKIQTLDCSFYRSMSNHLCYDLIMLENQLPLFVLESLFQLNSQLSTTDQGNVFITDQGNVFIRSLTFDKLIQTFIKCEYIRLSSAKRVHWDVKTNHLLHLLSDYFNLASRHHDSQSVDGSKIEGTRNFQCSFSMFSYIFSFSSNKEGNDENIEHENFLAPPTLTELWEAGVTIKKSGKDKNSMEISFKDGVLEIAHFEIDDHFENRVRNLMAFEHYHLETSKRHVTNYFVFLDELISTEKDVSLLVEAKILRNNIGGSHEEVSKLFNNLCKGVTTNEMYYYNTTAALSKYCKVPRHRWMASLRRDYFNSPWASVSFFAATFLIILTFMQTLYSHLTYFH